MSAVANIAINVDSRGAVSKLREIQNRTTALESATQSLTKSLRGLAAGLTIGAAVGAYFKGFNEAEQAKQKVASLGVDVASLEKELLKVSVASNGLASQTELLAASYDVASAGFGDTASNAKILEASLKGAVGGLSDINTVADAATSVLNAYGLSADNAGKLIDGFIQTQNDGKIVVDQYAQQIGKIAPTAAAAGISIEELNAAISTVTATGVPVESTFAGLRQAITAILKPSKEAQDLAAQLGIQFNETGLRSKGFGGILADVADKTGGSATALTTLFGSVEAVSTILPITNDKLEAFNGNLDNQRQKSGQAEEATKKLGGTVSRQIQAVSNGIGNLVRQLDTILGPALAGITSKLNDFVGGLNQVLLALTDAQIGAAVSELGQAGIAITFGATSQGLDFLQSGLAQLTPVLAKSEEDLDKYRITVQRFAEQLTRIPATSPLADRALSLQKQVTKLLNEINAADKKLNAASTSAKPPQKDKPFTPLNLEEPDKNKKTIQSLYGPGFQEEEQVRLQEKLIANQQAINEATIAGNEDLKKRLELERKIIPLRVRDSMLQRGLNILKGSLNNLTKKEIEELQIQGKIKETNLQIEANRLAIQNKLFENTGQQVEQEIKREKELQDAATKRTEQESGTLLPLQQQRELLEAQLNGNAQEVALRQQVDNILRQQPGLQRAVVEELVFGNAALQKQLNQVDLINQALQGAGDIIGNQLRSAIDGLIDGTADWNKILQDTLKQLGSFLIKFGLNTLAGSDGVGILSFLGFGTRASGGPVSPGSTYLVGERGPELLTMGAQGGYVHSNTSAAMDRYRAGERRRGTETVNVNYSVTEINGMRFVTEEQFRAGMDQAAKRGAKMGQTQTMSTLKNSRSQRSKIGL